MDKDQATHEVEFAYTSHRDSCRDPHLAHDGDLRECRRPANHQPPHASGFGRDHYVWED